jgi:DNA polymerase-3 subunit delta
VHLAEVRRQIASGETKPLYLLTGDDPQARHDVAQEFLALVDEGLHAFNVETFSAAEATSAAQREQLIGHILSAARTLPMMAPRRVVIVHAAERLLSPRKGGDEGETLPLPLPGGKRKRAPTAAEELEAYLAAPEPLTTLIFVSGDLDGTRRLVKLVRTHAVTVDCGSLSDAAEAGRWIRARLERDGLTIEPQAVTRLLQGTGLSLARIRADVEKLALFAAGESTVTVRHVRELVQPLSEPGENFAMGRAFWNGDTRAALREVAAQLDAGFRPEMVLGQIRAAVTSDRGRADDRIRQALDAVFETDLAIKSSGVDPQHVLERLVVDICGRSRP